MAKPHFTEKPLQDSDSVLILVDYQERLMPAIDQGPAVVAQAQALAELAVLLGVPVVGTEQNPQRLGPNAPGLSALCGQTLAKMRFDACADGLLDVLAAMPGPARARQVVVAGCETHVCLMQTALGLLRAGHAVCVVPAACGSRYATDKALALQRLHDAGAKLVSTEMLVFEWLGSCEHPRFKAALQGLKALPS